MEVALGRAAPRLTGRLLDRGAGIPLAPLHDPRVTQVVHVVPFLVLFRPTNAGIGGGRVRRVQDALQTDH